MPRRRIVPALVLTAALAAASVTGAAVADDDVPTRAQVAEARDAADAAAATVPGVQARLAVADARLQEAEVAAARAAEAFNGARWRAREARREVREALARSEAAATELASHRASYAGALTSSYGRAPELSALAAVTDAEGPAAVLETSATLQAVQHALDEKYDAFRAATTLADVATDRAEDAQVDADQAAEDARAARDRAAIAAEAAAAEARAVAAERTRLLAELARLQDVSVELATQRQDALEEQARERAAAAAAAEAEAAAAAAAEEAAPTPQPAPDPAPTPDPQPAPTPEQDPAPQPAPQPEPAPAPQTAAGVPAVLAFARAQLGEPYRWAAAGPSAWDCSGLTMGAWAAAGRSLPHYSVAQYEQSTPVSVGDLRPGDLVFWGDSGSPSSIYHVALYAGGGRIIHAPRTGRPVVEESMWSWTAPTFFARP